MQYRVLSTGSPPPPPIAFDDQVLRAFRVLRLFGRLRRLRAIIGGITSSIRPVLNAFLIIFVVASICEGPHRPSPRVTAGAVSRRAPPCTATLWRRNWVVCFHSMAAKTRPCAPILRRRT